MIEAVQHFFASIDWACWGVWTLTTVLMVIGLAGAVLPFVPGPMVIFVGALVHTLLRPQSGVSWWCIGILFVLMLVAYAFDFASGAVGAKWFGGSRWGMAGVIIGGLVGLFFGLIGLIIGPLVGGFAFEMLFAKMELKPAAKSTWGTVVGTGVGLAARLGVSIAMVAAFLIDALWW